jgi:hypothetical protein
LTTEKKEFIRYEVLNPFEDLAKFYDDGIISIKSINSGFGTMILHFGNSELVYNIIDEERRNFKSIFSGFEKLYTDVYNDCTEADRKGFKLPETFCKKEADKV